MRVLLPVAVALVAVGCSSETRAFCVAAGQCDKNQAVYDTVGDAPDSVDVCEQTEAGNLAVMRAAKSTSCPKVAEKYLAFLTCAGGYADTNVPCSGLLAVPDNACTQERRDFDETLAESDGACDAELP